MFTKDLNKKEGSYVLSRLDNKGRKEYLNSDKKSWGYGLSSDTLYLSGLDVRETMSSVRKKGVFPVIVSKLLLLDEEQRSWAVRLEGIV